jgi:hypothetical protein
MDTIDSNATNQSNSINSIKRNILLKKLNDLEQNIAILAMRRNQFDVAERHSPRCLVNSRRFRIEGKDKTPLIFKALSTYYIE